MQPSQFTITASIGESVRLSVQPVVFMEPDTTSLVWEKQSNLLTGFQYVTVTGTVLDLKDVSIADAAVYATYRNGYRYAYQFSLIRLIVRGKKFLTARFLTVI